MLGAIPPPLFCVAKEKKETKEKKESLNAETIKRLTNVINVTVLAILEHLEFKYFSCRPTMEAGNTFQFSMTPPL